MSVTITVDQLNKILAEMEERIEARLKKNQKEVKAAFSLLQEKLDEAPAKESASKDKTVKPKRAQSEGQKQWLATVKAVHAEMLEDDPTVTYQQAMIEASRRKDESDPAGAEKRAKEREKRAERKASKNSSKAGSDSEEEKPKKKTTKAASKAASKPTSEAEEEKPKKKVVKKPAKKEAVEEDSD
jgi:hypothetical protein